MLVAATESVGDAMVVWRAAGRLGIPASAGVAAEAADVGASPRGRFTQIAARVPAETLTAAARSPGWKATAGLPDHLHIKQNSVLEQLDGGLRLGAALSDEDNRPRGHWAVSDRSGASVWASMRA